MHFEGVWGLQCCVGVFMFVDFGGFWFWWEFWLVGFYFCVCVLVLVVSWFGLVF